ncbi:MAG: hypothetical protein A3G83_06005 [Betaproteobacteria bacterium RIFCSPLOWO2_12_FULL_68_20]|nr:MAG: hypothetical protein A3G83_06005 [Betaproteobacteria bacterium RIFCSPLOWO2_12_FULL_68_20]
MIGTIAITDEGWYQFLAQHPELEEVNFWTPSARREFRADRFSPFLFKLRAPHNAVCGFAFFAQFSRLPAWLAWDCFGIGNGCASESEMQSRILRIRERIRYVSGQNADEIGCIQLVKPVFFAPERWIPQPSDWHPRTQSSERYELSQGEGKRIWDACIASAEATSKEKMADLVAEPQARYGTSVLIEPRLGQATFRIAVIEAYRRACVVTDEHSLPALEAAHIRPYADQGPHDVRNGLLFRADLHRLFDKGYLTVTRDLTLEVSSRLKHEFHNGHSYYPLHGKAIRLPPESGYRPASEFLEWHNQKVYRA